MPSGTFLHICVCVCVCVCSEEMFVVLDYATLEHVCVEEESVGGANPLQLRVVMDQNSDGHREQIGLVAESK